MARRRIRRCDGAGSSCAAATSGGGCGGSPASLAVLHLTARDKPMVLPGRTGGTKGGVALTGFLGVEILYWMHEYTHGATHHLSICTTSLAI
jgi:hypothetical protein